MEPEAKRAKVVLRGAEASRGARERVRDPSDAESPAPERKGREKVRLREPGAASKSDESVEAAPATTTTAAPDRHRKSKESATTREKESERARDSERDAQRERIREVKQKDRVPMKKDTKETKDQKPREGKEHREQKDVRVHKLPKEKEKGKEKAKEKEKEKEHRKEAEGKEKSKDTKDRERAKEKDKDKEKEKARLEKEKEKEKEREREKEKEKEKEKERAREREREDKDREEREREAKEEEKAKRRRDREKEKLVAKVNAGKSSSKSQKQAPPPLPQEPESSPEPEASVAEVDQEDENAPTPSPSPEPAKAKPPPPLKHKPHKKSAATAANVAVSSSSPAPVAPAETASTPAAEEAEEAAAAAAAIDSSTGPEGTNSSVATFDVGGVIFKASAHLIRSQPTTLLAQLLDEGASGEKFHFVDCAPERFSYILDWYRYGEMNVPKTISVEALLRDAQFLQLPSPLVVNGVARSAEPNLAAKVGRDLVEGVRKSWPGFSTYLTRILKDLEAHFKLVGELSAKRKPASEEEEMEGYDFPPYILPVFSETGWVDARHLNSAQRARVLALSLEERGFWCQFSEAELVVTLPLRLRGEEGGGPGDEGDEDGMEDDGMDDYEENGDEAKA